MSTFFSAEIVFTFRTRAGKNVGDHSGQKDVRSEGDRKERRVNKLLTAAPLGLFIGRQKERNESKKHTVVRVNKN